MVGPRPVPVLVNRYEHRADELLREVGAENGDRLMAKVGLADVIDVGDWAKSRPGMLSFALMAHLDFVMVNDKTSEPLFAVEVDGAQHFRNHIQRARDRKKDEICREAGLPLLRINSDFARREGKYVLLKYICNAHYLELAFNEAQENGSIPWDEPFDHGMFIERDDDTGAIMFSSIDAKARAHLLELHKAGKLPFFAPDIWAGSEDEWGNIRADAYLGVGSDLSLVASTEVRSYGFFGVPASELAEELAVLDLRSLVDRWLAGEGVAMGAREFKRHFRDFLLSEDPMQYFSSTGPNGAQVPYPQFRISYSPKRSIWVEELPD